MKVYELQVKLYSLVDVNRKVVLEQLSKLIDTCLMQSEIMQEVHIRHEYKFYTYGAPMPLEKEGIYKKGNIYTFVLRTIDEALAEFLKAQLDKQCNASFKLLTVEVRELRTRMIERIYSLTPIILKFDTGYWKNKYPEEIFEKRVKENLIKKYNALYTTKIEEDFELFTYLKFDNLKPIAFHYKDITLLGDKITLQLATNPIAQELGLLAIGSGIGEMNSRGAGFVNYRFL